MVQIEMQSEKKNNTIQIMRGMAIIVVLLRHAIAQVHTDVVLDAVEQIIICFHMPVFFIIAGYLFQNGVDRYTKKGKARFLMDKAKHLLIPYVFWTVLLWIGVQVVCSIGQSVSDSLSSIGFGSMSVGNLVYGLLTYQVYYTEHLWFLYVLFLLFAIGIFTANNGDRPISLLIWLLIGLATLWVNLPHIIERTMLWGIFFAFGRMIRSQSTLEKIGGHKQLSICKICVILIFLVASALRLSWFNFGLTGIAASVSEQLIKYVIGFAGCGIIYTLAGLIKSTRSGEILKIVGDYSFDIYLMHNPYCVALCAVFLNQIIGILAYFAVVVATILGIVVPMVASKFVIRKSRLLSMIMIGK